MNCIFWFIKETIPKIHPKKHVMLITRKCNDTVDRRCCLLVHIIKKTLDMFAYQHLLKGTQAKDLNTIHCTIPIPKKLGYTYR